VFATVTTLALSLLQARPAVRPYTIDLAKQQFQTGYANYVAFLNAEQAYQQTTMGLIQAQANRYMDTVALFLALGGGWWNRGDLPTN
jgi:outer membrane protein TolC